MNREEMLEIAYKYSLKRAIKAKNLAYLACQTLKSALQQLNESEEEFNLIANKLKDLKGIEDVERRVNNCP